MYSGKVSIIGTGRVGMSAAYAMLLRDTARELVLFGRDVEKTKGVKMDLEHGLAFLGKTNIIAAESNEDLENSDVIIFTAGVAQEPGESRLSLVQRNTQILEKMLPPIAEYSPNSVVLIISNPVDILTFKAHKILGFRRGQVLGSGTSLDTARFRFYLSDMSGISPKSIHTYILGEHGDSSFPAISKADVGGQPLLTMPEFSEQKIQEAYRKARDAAGVIISTQGATYYAIGVVINQLVSAILRDNKRIFPISVPLLGEYGYNDVALSVPCVLGKKGVEKIIHIPLSDEEKKKMDNSVNVLKELLA